LHFSHRITQEAAAAQLSMLNRCHAAVLSTYFGTKPEDGEALTNFVDRCLKKIRNPADARAFIACKDFFDLSDQCIRETYEKFKPKAKLSFS
jgi:hypothetical protein